MGKAIVLDNALFADKNLGQATVNEEVIAVAEIEIRGAGAFPVGGTLAYSVAYTPAITTQKGVSWEIVGSPSDITVSELGVVTVGSSVSLESFTLKATSIYDSSVYTTKTVEIIQAAGVFTVDTIATGNINTSKKTAGSMKIVHYNGFIEATQGQTVTVVFPTLGAAYKGDSGYTVLYKIFEFSSNPANVLTTLNVACSNYITTFTEYTSLTLDSNGSATTTYTIQEADTNYVYIQWSVRKNNADTGTHNITDYGVLLSETTRANWATVMTEDANGTITVA